MHELVDGRVEFRKLSECLAEYFDHPEWKSGDPRGVGVLPRRQVLAIGYQHIGKESNPVKLETAEDTDGTLDGDEAGIDGAQQYGEVGGVGELLKQFSIADIAAASGVARRTLYDLRNGSTTSPNKKTLEQIVRAVSKLSQPSTPMALLRPGQALRGHHSCPNAPSCALRSHVHQC